MTDTRLEILYIGDTEEVMKQILETKVPYVAFAIRRNALEAVKYLMSGKVPDGILCDPVLNGGNAFEMHTFIRGQLGLRTPAFILVSNVFREDLYLDALRNKLDDFFVFPIESADGMIDRINFIREYKNKVKQAQVSNQQVTFKYNMPVSKRLFDVVVASMVLALVSPFLILIAIAIRLETKGKVYYVSKRVGRDTFNFYKLRSMRQDAEHELSRLAAEKNQYSTPEADRTIDFSIPCPRCSQLNGEGPCSPVLHIGEQKICEYWFQYQKQEIDKEKAAFIKIKNDPRITRVGKFIRNLSIDELPQLINVIRGDMSLVGNRPLPVYEAEKLTYDEMAKRFLAPAGITGLWQVELRGKAGEMSEEERKKLDNEYAEIFLQNKYSLWYDLKLILRTIPALFQKETV